MTALSFWSAQKICPTCGKSFPCTEEWGLTNGRGVPVCSPRCSTYEYEQAKARKEEARKRRKLAEKQKRLERKRAMDDGEPVVKLGRTGKAVEVTYNDGRRVVYSSVSDASLATGWDQTIVSRVCRAEAKQRCNCFMQFAKPEDRPMHEFVPRERKRTNKAVLQFTSDGTYIARYDSVKAAAAAIGAAACSVGNCASGINKTVYGYKFMYESEFKKTDKGEGS